VVEVFVAGLQLAVVVPEVEEMEIRVLIMGFLEQKIQEAEVEVGVVILVLTIALVELEVQESLLLNILIHLL
jgi:hypothetical protein